MLTSDQKALEEAYFGKTVIGSQLWFHGSPKGFDKFQTYKGHTFGLKPSEVPLFFSPSKSFAKMYAQYRDGVLYTVKLKFRRAFDGTRLYKSGPHWPPERDDLTSEGKVLYDDLAAGKVFSGVDEDDWSVFGDSRGLWANLLNMDYDVIEDTEFKRWLKKNRYDAAYVTGDGEKNIFVFHPKQVEIIEVEPTRKSEKTAACGMCFKYAIDKGGRNDLVVHGNIKGLHGPHAWVETKNGRVFDWQTEEGVWDTLGLTEGHPEYKKKGWPLREFYKTFKPYKMNKWPHDLAIVNGIRARQWGPWREDERFFPPTVKTATNSMVERVAAWKVPTPKLGPNQPLGVWDGTKVKYRTKSSSNGAAVVVYYGRKKIGSIGAILEYSDSIAKGRLKCQSDVDKLAAKYPQVVEPDGAYLGKDENREDIRVDVPRVWGVSSSRVESDYYGQRIGLNMYKAMMLEIFKKVGPFIFISDGCGSMGSTSMMAARVWGSLSRSMPSSGICIAVLKRPTLRAGEQ